MNKNPDLINLYYALAEGIHQWGTVENELSATFRIALQCEFTTKFAAASNAYWAAHSFRNKLEIVSRAVQSTKVSPCILTEWKRLQNKLSSKNNARNELAHFALQRKDADYKRACIMPYMSISKRVADSIRTDHQTMIPGKSPYFGDSSIKKLDEYSLWQRAKSFHNIRKRVIKFNQVFREEMKLKYADK